MGEPYANKVELISLHSTSKGLIGEAGFKGGYIETHNLDKFAVEMLNKLKTTYLSSNTIGQILTLLMVDPPRLGRESPETVKQYFDQINGVKESLRERAQILQSTL